MALGTRMRPGVVVVALPQPGVAVVHLDLDAVGRTTGLRQVDPDALIDGAARPERNRRQPGEPTGHPHCAVDAHVQRNRLAVQPFAGVVPAAAAVRAVEHVWRPPAADQVVDVRHRHGLDAILQLVAAGDRHHAAGYIPGRLDGGAGIAAGLGGLAAGLADEVDHHGRAVQVGRHRGAFRVVQRERGNTGRAFLAVDLDDAGQAVGHLLATQQQRHLPQERKAGRDRAGLGRQLWRQHDHRPFGGGRHEHHAIERVAVEGGAVEHQTSRASNDQS
ncbi:hypothetical protein D9M69_484220 [compost metagenome]